FILLYWELAIESLFSVIYGLFSTLYDGMHRDELPGEGTNHTTSLYTPRANMFQVFLVYMFRDIINQFVLIQKLAFLENDRFLQVYDGELHTAYGDQNSEMLRDDTILHLGVVIAHG
ncbi:hypothetical protein ACJX0J_017445, partial [Zea mays]